MSHDNQQFSRPNIIYVCVKAAFAALLAFMGMFSSATAQEKAVITLFAAGDVDLVNRDPTHILVGPAADAFTCAMDKMNQPYRLAYAPMSRAHILLEKLDNAVWFPSAVPNETSSKEAQNFAGPIGNIDIVWLTSMSNPIQPTLDTFKATARVTAYTGSAPEQLLIAQNYNFIKGSADRARLIYMLFANQVDAILAPDLRRYLPKDMQALAKERLKATIFKSTPVGYQISNALEARTPDFSTSFQKAINVCR